MSIKAGQDTVSDIVLVLSDGSASQTSVVKSQDANIAISPPDPTIVYNENADYNGLQIKVLVSGVETTLKTSIQSGVPLNNADLLNIRRLQPEAIIVQNISGVTTDINGVETSFKNFYPFSNEKFKLDRDIVTSPISSVVYFAIKQGDNNPSTKIQNALGININDIISTSGNDTILLANNKQAAQDIDIVITSLSQTSNASAEQVFSNIAKVIANETTTRSGVQDFINARAIDISVETKKEVLGIPSGENLQAEDQSIATNIGNNIVNIVQIINDAQDRGNDVVATSIVLNLLNSVDITQPSGTIIETLTQNIESEISQELGDDYVPLIAPPDAPTNLTISVIEATTTTTTTTTTTPDPLLTPTITQQPLNNYSSISNSENVPFSITAIGPENMTYQWQAWGYDPNTYNLIWRDIPNKTSNSVTINADELYDLTFGDSYYLRDIKIRCVISTPGFSDLISQVVYLDKYQNFGGYSDLFDINYNFPSTTETVGGTTYNVLTLPTSPVTLNLYEMSVYGFDLSWTTGNDITMVLQQSTDASNWTTVVTQQIRGLPYWYTEVPASTGAKYYRLQMTINWPLNVNNGTGSADRPPYTIPTTAYYGSTFKIIWS